METCKNKVIDGIWVDGVCGAIVAFLSWWWMLPFHTTPKRTREGQRGFGWSMKEAYLPYVCQRRLQHGGAMRAGGRKEEGQRRKSELGVLEGKNSSSLD